MQNNLLWLAVAAASLVSLSYASAASTETNAVALYGDFGVDLSGENPAIKPGDDFFEFANGGYLSRLKIPADQAEYGSFDRLADLSQDRVHAILETAAAQVAGTPDTSYGKIGAAYRAFMDEALAERRGAEPLKPFLERINHARDHADIARMMGEQNGLFSSAFDVGIAPDDKDPTRYAIQIGQSGLGLPDRDYYLAPQFGAKKAAYEAYVASILSLIGWRSPSEAAKSIVNYESAVAEASWSRAELRDPVAVYNPLTLADLKSLAPQFEWSAFMAGAHLDNETNVVIDAKTAFPKIAAIYASTPLDTLKAWLAFRLADGVAPYLSKDFQNARFNFRGKVLAGIEEQRPRWKRAVDSVNGILGEAVGQAYDAEYFPPSSKAQMEVLVANLKTALGARIQSLTWMSAATKAEALKKLQRYDVQIGYPKKWRDYSLLKISADDLLGNIQRSAAFEWAYQRGRLHKPVDKDEWLLTPQTVNAYNNPQFNEVVFPAAILQPPFFNPKADAAVNYGAIGAVIGHEMTHGFDDQGRKYDDQGRLRDWWTPDDSKNFEARTKALGDSYEKIHVADGAHIDGRLTMGENIADLGGLLTALDAYHASLEGKAAPVVDGLTGDQRFFLGFAQIWREKQREDALREQLVSDPHSPSKARVDGVLPNVDAWYRAFDVKPGEALYRAPEDRIRIW